jgi:hypothetical protein
VKGFAFYAELPEERSSKNARMLNAGHDFEPFTRASIRRWAKRGMKLNVFARYVVDDRLLDEGIGAATHEVNAPVCSTGASRDWFRSRTVRIDEKLARKLHPQLFKFLDSLEVP